MVPESQLEQTAEGLVAKTDGWFVLNARESRWYHAEGRSAFCDFEGEPDFTQLGINISVLGPGEPMAMYHWEADQEDFLVVSGEARADRRGRGAPATAVGLRPLPAEHEARDRRRRDGPCVVVAVGARDARRTPTGAATRSTRPPGTARRRAGDDRAGRGLRAI